MDGIRDGDCVTWPEGSATSNALIAETLGAVGHLRDLKLWFGILTAPQDFAREGWRAATYAGFMRRETCSGGGRRTFIRWPTAGSAGS